MKSGIKGAFHSIRVCTVYEDKNQLQGQKYIKIETCLFLKMGLEQFYSSRTILNVLELLQFLVHNSAGIGFTKEIH